MAKKKVKYTELDKTKDQLEIASFLGLKEKLRAANAEVALASMALKQAQPKAAAAEKRLEKHAHVLQKEKSKS